MKKILILLVMCTLVLGGCSSGNKKVDTKDLKTLCKDKEVLSQLSKKTSVADMVLQGSYIKLPTKLQTFYDLGWKVESQIEENPFVAETLMMKANSYIDIVLIKDLKVIMVKVINNSEQEGLLSGEMSVEQLTMYNDGLNDANDLVVKNGVTLKSKPEDVKAAWSSLKGYEDDSGASLETDNKKIVEMSEDSETNKLETIMLTASEGSDYWDLDRVEIENESIDNVKDETIALKRRALINSLKYPEAKYKKLVSDLKDKETVYNLLVKGKVKDKGEASQSYDTSGMFKKDIYIIEDSLGNQYSFYANVTSEITVPELSLGDEVELYCGNVELIKMEDEYNPLLTVEIVILNGVEVVNAVGTI